MFWWISVFQKCQEDRIHHFRCSLGPAIYRASEDCVWSGFLPNGKTGSASFNFKCESHGYITGILSEFNTVTKDRRYLGLNVFFFGAVFNKFSLRIYHSEKNVSSAEKKLEDKVKSSSQKP